MSTVKIYQFRKYDISNDSLTTSRRWATREAIAAIPGAQLLGEGVDVDESVVASDIPGMTAHDFHPSLHGGGFQRQVLR